MEKAIHADGMHWNNIKQDAIKLVKMCKQCMRYNITRKGYHPLKSITADKPGDHWAIDLAGPFENSHRGNHYLMVMVDICTKFVILKAIPDKTSLTIAEELINVFCDFGFPRILQSDNGTEFVNSLVKDVYKVSGIDHRLISPYHPRANGAAERTVQTAVHTLQKSMNGMARDWDVYVKAAQLAINKKIVRLHNSAPFELMFARRLNEFADYTDTRTAAHKPNAIIKRKNMIKDMAEIVLPAIAKRTNEVREAAQASFDKKK